MDAHLQEALEQFSGILAFRMYYTRSIGAIVIDPQNALVTKAKDHLGRYLGYFWVGDYTINFLLYVRDDPESRIGHVFLFRRGDSDKVVITSTLKEEYKRFVGIFVTKHSSLTIGITWLIICWMIEVTCYLALTILIRHLFSMRSL